MNKERLMKILQRPHVTEKTAMAGQGNNQVVFKVAADATKLEIRRAVETMFEVKVAAVRTSIVKGKNKRFGQVAGRRSDWKKAYISLQPGQNIEMLGVEQ